MSISLNGKWKLYFYDAVEQTLYDPSQLGNESCIDCTVPGNVEFDLREAGMLPRNLFKGENLLHVKISSSVLTVNDMESTVYSMGNTWRSQDEASGIRKAAHSVGWT